MSKKLIFTLISIVAVISFTIFSFANALILEGVDANGNPLTSIKQLCKDLKGNYKQQIADIKAKGLSLQLSEEDIKKQIADASNYMHLACNEVKDMTKSCTKLRTSYKKDIAWAKTKGLSLQLSQEEINQIIADLNAAKKYACGKIATLTSPVQLCSEAKKSYNKQLADIKAKGLSLQLSKEEIHQMTKDITDYKKKVCKEAATDKN